jgi:hypothetical protein
VSFSEPGFTAKLNQENQFGPWFTLSDTEKQQLGSPMGPQNPQALNRYSYVLNNPMHWTDPSGHCPTCVVGALFAGAGITISAPVIVAVAAAVGVTALVVFLSDANNRAWLSDQVSNGISDATAFTKELGNRVSAVTPPPGLVENPHRPGSWGKYDGGNGKYREYWRYDKGKPGAPGWEGKDHEHHYGGRDHLPPGTPFDPDAPHPDDVSGP